MWRVRLVTAKGEFVTHVLLPQFVKMPEVIVWGARYFQLCDRREYREVSAYAALSEDEHRSTGMVLDASCVSDWS